MRTKGTSACGRTKARMGGGRKTRRPYGDLRRISLCLMVAEEGGFGREVEEGEFAVEGLGGGVAGSGGHDIGFMATRGGSPCIPSDDQAV